MVMTLEQYLVSDELKKHIINVNKAVEDAVLKNSMGLQATIPSPDMLAAEANQRLASQHAVKPVHATNFAFFSQKQPATKKVPEDEPKNEPKLK